MTEDFKPDVIHFHNVWLLGPWIIGESPVAAVATLHDYWPICVRRSLVDVLERPCTGPSWLGCRLCRVRATASPLQPGLIGIEAERRDDLSWLARLTAVIAPSRYLASVIVREGLPQRLIQVVPNALASWSEPRAEGAGARPAVFVGRLTRLKGVDVLLRAFREPSLAGHRLVVAGGDGSGTKNVTFLGPLTNSEARSVIATAGCLVVPSVWPENCPMVAIEGLAAGIPVVASRIGGLPELVEEGVTGRLVSPGRPAQLAATVADVLSDPDIAARAAQRGPQVVAERHSMPGFVGHHERIYQSSVGRGH